MVDVPVKRGHETPSFRCGVFRLENGSTDGYGLDANLSQRLDVRQGDATYGHQWDVNAFPAHGVDDFLIAINANDWSQAAFGVGKAKRSAANIVHPLGHQSTNVLYGVSGAADDVFAFGQQLSSLCHGHVVFAQVHALCPNLAHQKRSVVENESATKLSAVWQQLSGGFRELSVARIFHAQLYPFAAATQGGLGSLHVAYTLVSVRDKLQWYHRLMSF